ncbi:ATP-binding cassette domain-containing protein [Ancylobacter sp. IITR112]|uniref:ATP-binding cassette domain-containing protein n=1 Tax=Ancylobacter sp. IITR112 TaxID=3138073 RepID=UPI00352AB7D5
MNGHIGDSMAAFVLEEAGFRIGDRALLVPTSLTLPHRRVVGLISPNGSGKPTLLKLLARQMPAGAGTIRFEGKDLAAWIHRGFARRAGRRFDGRVKLRMPIPYS